MDLKIVRSEIRKHADPRKAADLRWFFKTGPGEYGEGDVFLGIRVPPLRRLARRFERLPPGGIEKLLGSAFHEERLLALFIMVRQYERGDEELRRRLFGLYLRNRRRVNNWDLVDCSAPYILGPRLESRSRGLLYRLARSRSLWDRRMAVLATFHFVKRGELADTLRLAELLLADGEDLIHKAVGWMLREVGKRDLAAEESFLRRHCCVMPRTMLRYAIEKLPEDRRRKYLAGTP